MQKDLIIIGKILKTHGFKGHIKLYIDAYYIQDFKKSTAIFIDQLPYFITHKDINSDEQAIIKLEEIDTKEQAQQLCGLSFSLPKQQLKKIVKDLYITLVGHSVYHNNELIGNIIDIIELPYQKLISVTYQNKSITIPIHNDLIAKIDKKNQRIDVILPDGYLAIFAS